MIEFQGLPSRRIVFSLLTALFLLTFFLVAAPVEADGGIAMSGSFYQQAFEIPQGSSVGGPDVNVVVFNNSGEQLKIRMTSQTPPGVRLNLSQSDFTLPASGQLQILVGIEVSTNAAPGHYEISLAAESYKDGVSGIQLVGAASQKASLVVLGESGMVSVQSTSPDLQPITATVRLYRIIEGQIHEVAYSETGNLEAKVAPGSFLAASFVGGTKLAEEKFAVSAGETKEIILSGATFYFEGFDVVPNTKKDTGKLAFVQIVYTIKNLYKRVEKGEVILHVNRDSVEPAELLLATLSPLETGRAGLNYNYIPTDGWADGSYNFKLQLNVDGRHYTDSPVKSLAVSGTGSVVVKTTITSKLNVTEKTGGIAPTRTMAETIPAGKGSGETGGASQGINPILIGVIIAAVLLVAGIAFWIIRKNRRL